MITINGYPIDVAVTEEHAYESDVTEHPVEQGSDVTDNVRNKPATVNIEGVVSDSPIGVIAFDATRGAGSRPSSDAYAKLLAVRDAREPVTITTSLGLYENMVLKSLSVPRSATVGKALRFRATFTQILIVQNQRTTVKTAVPRGKGKKNLGTKPSPDATSVSAPVVAEKRESVAHKALNKIKGLF